MQSLYRQDRRACGEACPLDDPALCESLCAKAAAVNAYNERGKLFNVPFRAPPLQDLNTGATDEDAWAALGQRAFSRVPWKPADAPPGGQPPHNPLPSMMMQSPVDGAAPTALRGAFYGWQQVPDALRQRTFVPPTDEQFARSVDLNQAMSGYMLSPVVQAAEDGPLSSLKPTSFNAAGQLPQAQPFAGIGFNLSQNVPRRGVANVRGVPTLFQSSTGGGVGGMRAADLSA